MELFLLWLQLQLQLWSNLLKLIVKSSLQLHCKILPIMGQVAEWKIVGIGEEVEGVSEVLEGSCLVRVTTLLKGPIIM